MSEPALQTQIAAANAYESLFVQALFQEWAPRLADSARIQSGQRVLDVACGTGVLAREAASRVGSTGSVVALDPNPGMLAVAERIAPAVEFRHGVAELLPFSEQSFDVVVSQFGLMFFTDRRQAIREMLRVLKPKGRLVVAVWDSLDHNPAYADAVELLDRVAGRQAGDALRAPFVLGDTEVLSELFSKSDADSIEIKTYQGTAQFPSIRVMVEADLRGWLPVVGVILTEEQISHILQEAEQDLSAYVTVDGKARFQTSAHFVEAVKMTT